MVNLFYLALLVACCAYALWYGGAPERWGAAIIAVGSVLTTALTSAPVLRFRSVELGVLGVDVVALLAFLVLALRAERFWPLWVTALQVVGLVGHLAKLASPEVIPWA